MPAWIKPLKFAMSISIYLLTLIWLPTFVQECKRWVHLVGSIVGVGLLIEITLFATQVMRGQPLLAPDMLTWTALAILIGVEGAASATILLKTRRAT